MHHLLTNMSKAVGEGEGGISVDIISNTIKIEYTSTEIRGEGRQFLDCNNRQRHNNFFRIEVKNVTFDIYRWLKRISEDCHVRSTPLTHEM